jgi:hypothetical protein
MFTCAKILSKKIYYISSNDPILHKPKIIFLVSRTLSEEYKMSTLYMTNQFHIILRLHRTTKLAFIVRSGIRTSCF